MGHNEPGFGPKYEVVIFAQKFHIAYLEVLETYRDFF